MTIDAGGRHFRRDQDRAPEAGVLRRWRSRQPAIRALPWPPSGWSRLDGHRRYDFVHGFSRERAEIEAALPAALDAIGAGGTIWISWPKKASKVPTDLTENIIRDVALKLDLVDVTVDAIWSGLKLVIRKDRR